MVDGSETPLLARSLILAVGTYGMPRKLGVEGESLGLVSHRCSALPSDARRVLVVGAGLSAADCIVHLLRRGAEVLHAFRGAPEATKVGSKFGHGGARVMYPEYHALVRGMNSAASDAPLSLLGGKYRPLQDVVLQSVHADGHAILHDGAHVHGAEGASMAKRERVDGVAVLIGSEPDLSFLPDEVHDELRAAGPPSQLSADGVKATHPVFLAVDPFTMESRAVRGLHALGPLRGDNFARFAMHDGHGVAAAVRARSLREYVREPSREGDGRCAT